MAEKKLDIEEQRLKVRRRLLKLAVYSIPVISTALITEETYAATAKKKKRTPEGKKLYSYGLS